MDHVPERGLTVRRPTGADSQDLDDEAYHVSFDALLGSATEIAVRIEWEADTAPVFARLFRHLTSDQRHQLYPELLRMVSREEVNSGRFRNTDRRRYFNTGALAASAGLLTPGDRDSLIPAAFEDLEAHVSTDDHFARGIADIAPHLPRSMHERLLSAFIASAQKLSRPRLLQLLPNLLPALEGCEGPPALRILAGALRDSSRWFQ
jgi:hypothetical protein